MQQKPRPTVPFVKAEKTPSQHLVRVAPCMPTCSKVIQYISFVKSDSEPQSLGDSFTTSGGETIPWLPGDQFEADYPAGHGTHVAGSVAGSTLNNPAELATCEAGKTVSCVGGCVEDTPAGDDDLVSSSVQQPDIDRACPLFDNSACENADFPYACLGDDVSETLTKNGGMAQGAKLAIFDAIHSEVGYALVVGNGLWEPCVEAGCKLHTNSWGGDFECQYGPTDLLYDEFMYEVIRRPGLCVVLGRASRFLVCEEPWRTLEGATTVAAAVEFIHTLSRGHISMLR